MADETRTSIRLPDELLARLRAQAKRDHRSVHAQMVAYIERCLDQDEEDHDRKGS
jgi:predicted DNA-binding protein